MKTKIYVQRPERIRRCAISFLLAILMIFSSALAVQANAAGTLSAIDLYRASEFWKTEGQTYNWVDFDAKAGSDMLEDAGSGITACAGIPSWEALTNLHNSAAPSQTDPNMEKAYRNWATLDSYYKAFGTKAAYDSAVKDLVAYVRYDPATDSLAAKPNTKESAFTGAVSKFNSSAVSQQAEAMFKEIYDMDTWNPSAGQAANVLATIYKVVNTVFYVVAQLLMWCFLLQTGFDMLYLVIEPVRPFIGPKDSGGGGTVNNGAGGFLSKIHIPIASKAAAAAANGDGGVGGNNGGGGGGAIFLSYGFKRFPILLMSAVYIILVANGYWTKVIAWVSSIVCNIINFFLNM